MFVCWGVSRCPWACAEGWSDAIKKTFLGCLSRCNPCYTISLRPENTIFPSCAPHWLFSQMVKSSRCAGEGALGRVKGLYSISGHFYNPILFDTVRLSGSNYKRVKNTMIPAMHFVDITYMLWGKNTDLSVRLKLDKTVHIWNEKAEETQGVESVIIHISLKRSNGLNNRVRAKKTNVFRAT